MFGRGMGLTGRDYACTRYHHLFAFGADRWCAWLVGSMRDTAAAMAGWFRAHRLGVKWAGLFVCGGFAWACGQLNAMTSDGCAGIAYSSASSWVCSCLRRRCASPLPAVGVLRALAVRVLSCRQLRCWCWCPASPLSVAFFSTACAARLVALSAQNVSTKCAAELWAGPM